MIFFSANELNINLNNLQLPRVITKKYLDSSILKIINVFITLNLLWFENKINKIENLSIDLKKQITT